MSAYEKVRQERIRANNARLAELGLRDLARDIASQVQAPAREAKPAKPSTSAGPVRRSDRLRAIKSNKNEEVSDESDEEMIVTREIRDEEEDYVPPADEEHVSEDSSDGEHMSEDEESNQPKTEEVVNSHLDFKQDEDDLQEAIALSLEEVHDGSLIDSRTKAVKKSVKEDSKRRKKPAARGSFHLSTKDIDILYHAIVQGRRGLSLRELQQAASAHNFTWTKQELQDMIRIFDTDQDGMLNLDEFLNMSTRCHILED
ncbi:uncharacterized protein LOC9652239 [Selaginella moellendorffii]|nr:uncharacterized protein LOC9652239 [Selaginella moellendorffii]|eukprot:XP_002993071.2 uncharacterized protein LOC9652239 [Selaginella moellendorffii]